MGVKFKMDFVNAQDIACSLQFIVDDDVYSEDPVIIYGGPRPFVLSEFNNDLDFFKPVRPQQGTIEILASASGVSITDFIVDDDDKGMKVLFTFGSYGVYWYGIISQDDISEIWIAQNHIITLRADDGLGSLKNFQLQDDQGNKLVGSFTPLQYLEYCTYRTARRFLFSNIISNLFYNGMNTGVRQTGLDQCVIYANTFESAPDEFDDMYTVAEKINSAFNQTMFQYDGEWWVVRLQELFINQAGTLAGFQNNKPSIGQRSNTLNRFMMNVGVSELVKPLMPEMIKTLIKPSKETIVRYEWETVEQTVCNESFQEGELLGSTIVDNVINYYYDVADWLHKIDQPGPTIFYSTKDFGRYVLLGQKVEDEYVQVEVEDYPLSSFIESCEFRATAGSILKLSFQAKWGNLQSGQVGEEDIVAQVILTTSGGAEYAINEDGAWFLVTSHPIIGVGRIVTNKDDVDYYKVEVETDAIPYDGSIIVRLYIDGTIGEFHKRFRDLTVELIPSVEYLRLRKIAGDYDKWTIGKDVNKNTDKQIFIDNGYDGYKGTLYLSDATTKTGNLWITRAFPTDYYSFKEHNSRANWFFNKRHRAAIEGNFFGLEWERDGNKYPIGLINTVKFVDDDPDKTFAIVNMREMDFMNCTWSADLVEIWDEDVDTNIIPSASDVRKWDVYYD